MKVTIWPQRLRGEIRAISSKSAAHRLLICGALAERPTEILCENLSADIEATAEALRSLGAEIAYEEPRGAFRVTPIRPAAGLLEPESGETGQTDPILPADDPCGLDVGESGSTLRFLLPVICALGRETRIVMHGRLGERPLSPLWEELIRHGCELTRNPDGTLGTRGKLRGGTFSLAANISSQFISGLLFALPLMGEESRIRLEGPVESEGYIRMTMQALARFGVRTEWEGDTLRTFGGLRSPGRAETEGDWSAGAFWEVAAMLSDGDAGGLCLTGLDPESAQGDRAVRSLKKEIAAGNAEIDARNIPDLVPILAVQAALSPGTTVFTGAGRLRLKESDRIASTVRMLTDLGGRAEETAEGLIVRGQTFLRGGTVDSCGDHRIAMSAAVASIACWEKVVINGAQAVRKSYPGFWEDFERLGGRIQKEDA